MPRKHRKHRQDSDQELDVKESNSKWASVLNQASEEDEEEDLMPKKKVFEYDFSKEHRLLNEKEPPKKQEPKIVLSPQEQAELDRKLEKQRIEKEEKLRAKKEKRQQKKKIIEKQKEEEKLKKQEEQKEQQQLQKMVSHQKGNSDSKKIILTMLAALILLGVLNYQKDIYARLSKFKIASNIDYYEVLQISRSASDSQLKNQYKKLVMKYHPDKNPNCHSCREKFTKVMDAWEILGNPEKRTSYDQSIGVVTQIPSNTITLTPQNYPWLVGNSDAIWLVQAYDSTNQFCHYFASFWEQFAAKYQGFVNVARTDVWQQTQMKSYLPYKFQIFPGLYTMHMGQQRLCQVDYERPYRSLQLCVEEQLQQYTVPKISDWSEIPEGSSKLTVILGGGIKLSLFIKLIHSKFVRYMNFYIMNDKSTTVMVKGTDHKFSLNVGTNKSIFTKYRQFLQGVIRQKKTSCEILYECRNRPCLLLLDQQVKTQNLLPFPLIEVKEDIQFAEKIQHIKNVTGMHELFEVGYYQDGKIELGYFSEVNQLNPYNGEVIQFECQRQSFIGYLIDTYDYFARMIDSSI